MKAEGGVVATTSGGTASVLHKIKVKEEVSKECCGVVQPARSPASPSSRVGATTIGAIATITISSGNGSELAAAAAATAAALVGKRNDNDDEDDALPVDLDLKSRTNPGSVREKSREAVNGRESSSPSPSSSPGSSSQSKHHPRSAARSPLSDEPAGLQSLKTESPEEGQQRQEDGKGIGEGNARCIGSVFGAHGKLRRLLGTLVHFAMDISAEAAETVRGLILGLLSGSMSAEEFHSALQEATNFPLRGFVLPYLRHTLPSLQRDLNAAARADNQTCAQYLRSNEAAVLEAVGPGIGPAAAGEAAAELFAEHANPPAHHYPAMRPTGAGPVMHSPATASPTHLAYGAGHPAKRRASEALYYENGGVFDDGLPYAKRASSHWSPHHQPHPAHHHHQQQPHGAGHHHQASQHLPHQPASQQAPAHSDPAYCWYSVPSQHGHGPVSSLVQPVYGPLAQPQLPHQPSHGHAGATVSAGSSGAAVQNGSASLEDEWKNIHVMLNCILGMVEKTKRALAILQKRGCTSPAAATSASLQAALPMANAGQPSNGSAQPQQLEGSAQDREGTFKRLSGEIVAQTIRATEDRVAEVKRRAEEAVLEVKRAAVAEVQRAVAAAMAESRATERLRSQRYLDGLGQQQRVQQQQQQQPRPSPFLRLTDARTSSVAEADKEAHVISGVASSSVKSSMQSCWNCGRPALETCGGCGVARYCGSFCQHRDWEAGGHHASCASSLGQKHERARSATPSPPRATSATSGTSDSEAANKPTSSSLRASK